MDAVDEVVVLGGEVGVAVDEGGVGVVAEEIVGGGRRQVFINRIQALAAGAAPAQVASEHHPQPARLGPHFGQPDGVAHLGAVGLVAGVVEAECIAVREDE